MPYPPAEVADLTVDRATIPEAVPKEIKGVDRVTKPGPGSMESSAGPGSMESTAGPGSMESTAGPGSMESTAATKPPSSLPVCPYGDKCYRLACHTACQRWFCEIMANGTLVIFNVT